VIPAADGAPAVTFTVQRRGTEVVVRWQGEPNNWRLLLVGAEAAQSVAGGIAALTGTGLLITPDTGATTILVTLAA
jgi:hypothetical protein